MSYMLVFVANISDNFARSYLQVIGSKIDCESLSIFLSGVFSVGISIKKKQAPATNELLLC